MRPTGTAQVIGEYRAGRQGRIIDETDDEPVLAGAPPLPCSTCDNPVLRPVPLLC